MEKIAKWLTDFFIRRQIIPEEEREIYEYGFDITVYTFISTLGLLAIGAVLHRFCHTAVILAIFSLSQTHGGGFHANSHAACFLTMTVSLLAALGISYCPIPTAAAEAACMISVSVLLLIPLTLHPNKAYLKDETPRLARKSRIVTLSVTGVSACLVYLVHLPIMPFALALTMSALSRAVAAWQRKKRRMKLYKECLFSACLRLCSRLFFFTGHTRQKGKWRA